MDKIAILRAQVLTAYRSWLRINVPLPGKALVLRHLCTPLFLPEVVFSVVSGAEYRQNTHRGSHRWRRDQDPCFGLRSICYSYLPGPATMHLRCDPNKELCVSPS